MEGLKFGWKKSIKFYHYYPSNDTHSLCKDASYHLSLFRNQEFLSEIEIDDVPVCTTCRAMRQSNMRDKIVDEKKRYQGFWDTSRVCPKCKKNKIFWNQKNKDEHFCDTCSKVVSFA